MALAEKSGQFRLRSRIETKLHQRHPFPAEFSGFSCSVREFDAGKIATLVRCYSGWKIEAAPLSLTSVSSLAQSSTLWNKSWDRNESSSRRSFKVQYAATDSETGPVKKIMHKVEVGESLYRIASLHGITVEELLLENPEVEVTKLRPGTILVIDDGVHRRFSKQDIQKAANTGDLKQGAGELARSVGNAFSSLGHSVKEGSEAALGGVESATGRAAQYVARTGQYVGHASKTATHRAAPHLQFSGTNLAAAVLGALLAWGFASKFWGNLKEEPLQEEPGLRKPEPFSAEPEPQNGQVRVVPDAELVAVLRGAKEYIPKLQAERSRLQEELALKEERWQAMLVREEKDHKESKLLKAKVKLLEQKLEEAKGKTKA